MIFEQEAYNIVGVAMAVHSYFGCGFHEKVYQEAMEIEMGNRKIPAVRETPLHPHFGDVIMKSEFVPDFICYDKIIVELKAVREIDDVFRAQAINYARVGGYKLSILLNFGEKKLQVEYFPIYANL